ncbi:MAG: hypothetical protein MJ211_15910 [Bacteroidales bacterium]|nr:hypothetical protein [Bacteroidales bacterium]
MNTNKFIALIIGLIISINVNAQCKQRFVYECAMQNPGQVFMREFNTKFSNGKIQKHKVILNKGYYYTLQLCNPSDAKFSKENNSKPTGLDINSMLSLYDNNNNILATTSQDSKFTFFCPKTDVYWVNIMPLSPKTTCAVGILSFMKSK